MVEGQADMVGSFKEVERDVGRGGGVVVGGDLKGSDSHTHTLQPVEVGVKKVEKEMMKEVMVKDQVEVGVEGEKVFGNLGNSGLDWPNCPKKKAHQLSFEFEDDDGDEDCDDDDDDDEDEDDDDEDDDMVGGLKEVERDVCRGGGVVEGGDLKGEQGNLCNPYDEGSDCHTRTLQPVEVDVKKMEKEIRKAVMVEDQV